MSSGGTNSETSRHHSGLPATPSRGNPPAIHTPNPGSGFVRVTEHDSRTPDDLKLTAGRVDAGFVTLVYIDREGHRWYKREWPRLTCPVSGDWNDATMEPYLDVDGKTHYIAADGLSTLFPGAPDEYSRDVGQSIGTAHLPPEPLPIVPGRRFGPDRQLADIEFWVPDGPVKKVILAGDGPGQGGKKQIRKTQPTAAPPAGGPVVGGGAATPPPPDLEAATLRRGLEEADVEDMKPTVTPAPAGGGPGSPPVAGLVPPMASGAPGYSGHFPFLHERLPNNPHSNCLLKGSTVPSPYGGVLDTDTVYEYNILKEPTVTLGGGDYCQLLPYAARASVDTNIYSYEVSQSLICEWINRGTMVERENIERAHALAKAVAAFAKEIVCCAMDSSSFAAFKSCLKAKLNTDAAMKKICQAKCRVSGPVITGDDPEEEPGSGGGGGGGGGSGGGSTVSPTATFPGAPPGWTAGSRTSTAGTGPAPAGAIFGGSRPVPPIAGGGTLTFWWTATSYGYMFTPPGSPPPGGLSPCDVRLKRNINWVGQCDGINLYEWEWNDLAAAAGLAGYPTRGVLAQEIRATHPDAVTVGDHGYLVVDYTRVWK